MILNSFVILLVEGSVKIFVVNVGLIFLFNSIVWNVLVICIGSDSGCFCWWCVIFSLMYVVSRFCVVF